MLFKTKLLKYKYLGLADSCVVAELQYHTRAVITIQRWWRRMTGILNIEKCLNVKYNVDTHELDNINTSMCMKSIRFMILMERYLYLFATFEQKIQQTKDKQNKTEQDYRFLEVFKTYHDKYGVDKTAERICPYPSFAWITDFENHFQRNVSVIHYNNNNKSVLLRDIVGFPQINLHLSLPPIRNGNSIHYIIPKQIDALVFVDIELKTDAVRIENVYLCREDGQSVKKYNRSYRNCKHVYYRPWGLGRAYNTLKPKFIYMVITFNNNDDTIVVDDDDISVVVRGILVPMDIRHELSNYHLT